MERYRKRKWTKEEDEFLRQNFGKLPIQKMADYLRRSFKATYNRCYLLGLSKTGKPSKWRKWTSKEKEFLRENYKKFTNQELAQKLGRSINAIQGMARILELKKKKGRKAR